MFKQARQYFQNNRRVAVRVDRTTVVQQQYVASGKVSLQSLINRFSRFCKGIQSAPSPVDIAQARALDHRGEKGIAETHRRAKEDRGDAGGRMDRVLCRVDFATHSIRPEKGKCVGVAVGVVFHAVSATDDFTGQLGMCDDLVGDAEEAGLDPVSIEQVKHLGRDDGVGPVIKGECHFSALRSRCGQACHARSEQAAVRPKDHCCCKQKVIHYHSPQRPLPDGGIQGGQHCAKYM